MSTRSLATLLGITAPTIIYWQNHFNGEIPDKFIEDVDLALGTLDEISKASGHHLEEILPTIIELRKSPFWKDWGHLKQILLQGESEISKSPYFYRIEGFLKKKHPELKEFKGLEEKVGKKTPTLDLAFKDKKGNLVGVLLYTSIISFPNVLKGLTLIEKIRAILPNSTFYIFASLIENSVRLGLEDLSYITLVEYKEKNDMEFEIKK